MKTVEKTAAAGERGGAEKRQKPTPCPEQPTETAALENKILHLLGFAARARRLTIGVSQVCEALRGTSPDKMPFAVIEAGDTSPATHKRIGDKTTYYHTPHIRLSAAGAALAAAIGKKEATVGAVGVTEPHIAAEIKRLAGN